MAVRHSSVVAAALVLVALLVALAALTDVFDAPADEGVAQGVPMPVIARGQGDNCVDDPEFLRRYHMMVLQREHDKAQLTGMPGEKYSLKECVACHAVMGPKGRPVTADSPEHFCRTCHDYVAVQIDCFDCHRSRGRRVATRQPREPT